MSGPSDSGKSHLMHLLLKHRKEIFTRDFGRILYCTNESGFHMRSAYLSKLRQECNSIEIEPGLPDFAANDLFINKDVHKLVLLDDLMMDIGNSKQMMELFLGDSHHHNITVVYSTQNMFLKSTYNVSINRNITHLALFKSNYLF